MTTAHRPTYNPTKGGNIQGGNKLYYPSKQYSSKDLPGNLTLKKREFGQGTKKELRNRNFKLELFERERKSNKNKNNMKMNEMYKNNDYSLALEDGETFTGKNCDLTTDLLEIKRPIKKPRLEEGEVQEQKYQNISESSHEIDLNRGQRKSNKKLMLNNESDNEKYENEIKEENKHSDDEQQSGSDYTSFELNNKKNLQSDEEGESYQQENDEEEEAEDEEDENLEGEESEGTDEELMREYEKIKKMREEEKKQKENENAEKVKKQAEEQLLMGNPLVNVTGYSLKKKWFEDTVFKNQSKNEPKLLKRFVNDTVRSDFHRKFLSKSIQ